MDQGKIRGQAYCDATYRVPLLDYIEPIRLCAIPLRYELSAASLHTQNYAYQIECAGRFPSPVDMKEGGNYIAND